MVLPTVRTRRIALPLQASRRKVRFCSPTASLPKEFLRPPIRPACWSRLLEHSFPSKRHRDLCETPLVLCQRNMRPCTRPCHVRSKLYCATPCCILWLNAEVLYAHKAQLETRNPAIGSATNALKSSHLWDAI